MKKRILCIFICILFVFVPVLSATGINYGFQHNIDRSYITTGWVEQSKLLASDGDSNDNFGVSVSIDGDYAIVGAWLDEENGVDSGSAYVFKLNNTNWDEGVKLTASDSKPEDRFGQSVSIDGDYAIVGTWPANSAYIFKRDGTNWTQQAKLTGSEECFGLSVSIDGDYAIVGSHGEDNFIGAAYIFKRDGTNWTQQAKLTGSDGAKLDCFGISVSIDGDYAIIGAYKAGSAYIFKRDGTNWTQQAKMTGLENSFGHCVSIDGDYALVGEDVGNNWKGAAYVFKRDGTNWIEDAKLTASDGADGDDFGCSVSINGEYIIVGADCDGSTGSAYIFKCNGTNWIEEAKLLASDGEDDVFGTSVSIDREYAIIGAYYDNDNGEESGSAYVFKKNQQPDPPKITGPTGGTIGKPYNFTFTSTDPDGDDVKYFIDWGDGTTSETVFKPSGSPGYNESHSWYTQESISIQAKTIDIYGAESDWSVFTVKMPRNKMLSSLFISRFLESFPLLNFLFQKIIS